MSSMIGTIVGGAMGTVGGIFGSIAGIKADQKLSSLLKENPTYKSSPYASNTLGMAQNLLNSRMTGAASREKNIMGAQANTVANINRNATDSSQALALAAGAQGQSNQASNDLQLQEGMDFNNKLNNLNTANQGMTQEHKDVYDDSIRQWQDRVNTVMTQYKMRQAGAQSFTNMGGSAQSGLNSAGMSDKRLKHNYHIIGKSPSGINIYEFSYNGSNDRYVGVMAQEVGDAAFMTESGYLAVDYSKIDVQFKQV